MCHARTQGAALGTSEVADAIDREEQFEVSCKTSHQSMRMRWLHIPSSVWPLKLDWAQFTLTLLHFLCQRSLMVFGWYASSTQSETHCSLFVSWRSFSTLCFRDQVCSARTMTMTMTLKEVHQTVVRGLALQA